jgi:hypothetical protein
MRAERNGSIILNMDIIHLRYRAAANNRVCGAPISISVVGVAPCACSIITIKNDLSRHTAQTRNVICKSVRRNMKDLKEAQNNFFSAFDGYINSITTASFNKENKTFKKVLLVSVIDALSKCAYPHKSPGKRFVSFIDEFCQWELSNKVSMSHLIRFLNKIPDTEFSDLRKYLLPLFDSWLGNIRKDPDLKDIQKLWPKNIEYEQNHPLSKFRPESCAHKWLLYKYRNQLVHNLKVPGHPFEMDGTNEPFYHSASDENNESYWELVYPLGFFMDMCKAGLSNLKTYCENNRFDPYESYEDVFGTYWIEEIN